MASNEAHRAELSNICSGWRQELIQIALEAKRRTLHLKWSNTMLRANDTRAWTPNNVSMQSLLCHRSCGNHCGEHAIGSWARYPGLGTLATGNPGEHAIGSWARYPGLGTLA